MVLVVLLVAVGVLVPMMCWGIPSGGDLANHYRFAQPFYESIRSGHFYPGWLAESNYGFGDARFRFYPPGLYYLMALFRLVSGWYAASLLAFITLSMLGGGGAYFWARQSHSTTVAMWAGVLYSIAPYHLNQIYQASLLSEYAACSVLPFLFAFVERVCRRRSAADVAGLGVTYALLVLTHLPLTVIGSLSIAVYALLLLRRERLWSNVLRLTTGVVIGLTASAFFWTTVIAEMKWIKGNSANQNGYYNYRNNFLFSSAALTNRNTWYANLLAFAVVGMALPALLLIRKKWRVSNTKAVAGVTGLSFLMATDLSRPLWLMIPKLSDVQFPWRWLTITSLGASILVAASVPKWKEVWRKEFRPVHLVPIGAFVLSLFFVATQVVIDCEYLPRQQFEPMLSSIRNSASFPDWLPAAATQEVTEFGSSALVAAGSRAISVKTWEPEHREFKVGAGTSTAATVRTYFYPLWKATVNDRPVTPSVGKNGAMMVELPGDEARIKLDFVEPMRVKVVRIASLFGWLTIASLFGFGLRFRTRTTA